MTQSNCTNNSALKQQGLKIFLLLRLSPIIPFNAINYIGGVTGVSLKDYSLALGGILPGTILFCFIGASAGNLSESQDRKNGPATIAAVGKNAKLPFQNNCTIVAHLLPFASLADALSGGHHPQSNCCVCYVHTGQEGIQQDSGATGTRCDRARWIHSSNA